jgi:Ca-activated chloride channel homolog
VKGRILWLSLFFLAACGVNAAERNNAGNSLFQQGNYDEALSAYQSAEVVAPDQPEPYYNAASAFSATGDFEAAVASLQQALASADPELAARAYHNLGNVYFAAGIYEEAVKAYENALLLNPNDHDARYNLELALNSIPTPTPPPQEQKVEPEQGETDPEVTPTNNPAGQDGPTPSPPPQEGPPDLTAPPSSGTGDETGRIQSTITPRPEGSMSLKDAQRLLDSIQEDQQTLREFLEDMATPASPSDKDW